MSEWESFWSMGGYARYVWSAYGITTVVLVLNIVVAVRSKKRSLKHLSNSSESNLS